MHMEVKLNIFMACTVTWSEDNQLLWGILEK